MKKQAAVRLVWDALISCNKKHFTSLELLTAAAAVTNCDFGDRLYLLVNNYQTRRDRLMTVQMHPSLLI